MPSRRFVLAGLAASAAVSGPNLALANKSKFGSFSGDFVGRFPRNGVAILEEDLIFTDPNGRRWKAPKGTEVNGASIPRPLWSIIGSPFTGSYLRASVIHDHYCVTMERGWRDTHKMFWYGCRAGGASEFYANLLYAGVRRFGPRWIIRRGASGASARPQRVNQSFNKAEFKELEAWIKKNKPSIEEIEARITR